MTVIKDYTPLPSFALTRSSFDLHLLHLIAFGAFIAPHFMHTFLFNIRASASGNLAISKTAYLEYPNKDILYKHNVVSNIKESKMALKLIEIYLT